MFKKIKETLEAFGCKNSNHTIKALEERILESSQKLRAFEQRDASKTSQSINCRIEIYKDKAGEFRWRLKAANNKTIAESGEGYKNLQNLEKSLNLVRKVMDVAETKTISN